MIHWFWLLPLGILCFILGFFAASHIYSKITAELLGKARDAVSKLDT